MIPNPLLSITIPTYNRADFLDYSLEIHIPLASAYNVQIFISDNASTDTTKMIVEKWQKEYPLIHYFCNETNLGPDKNFELALKYPETEYVWLFGDTYQIPAGGISRVMDILERRDHYNAIVFNVIHRASDVPQQEYSNQNKLLSDLGWHMTCLAVLIYSKQLILHANFERYYDTYFIQTGIIFEYIAKKDFLIYWEPNISVKGLQHPQLLSKNSWQYQAIVFDIACVYWSNFIFSFPSSYNLEIKLKCILDHGDKAELFSWKNLFYLRRLNILNLSIYKRYAQFFPFTLKYHPFVLLLISILPKQSYDFLKFIKNNCCISNAK